MLGQRPQLEMITHVLSVARSTIDVLTEVRPSHPSHPCGYLRGGADSVRVLLFLKSGVSIPGSVQTSCEGKGASAHVLYRRGWRSISVGDAADRVHLGVHHRGS